MAESFENLENNLRGRAILIRYKKKKKTCRGTEQVRKAGRRKIQPFLVEKISKKYSSSVSRQSSKTKPNTNLVLVGREPLLCLELNKSYRQNVSEINLFKKFNFQAQSQNNC